MSVSVPWQDTFVSVVKQVLRRVTMVYYRVDHFLSIWLSYCTQKSSVRDLTISLWPFGRVALSCLQHASRLSWGGGGEELTEIEQVSTHSSKFAGRSIQSLEHFCSKGRTFLHCQKVGEIPGYRWTHLPCRENCVLLVAAANQSACFALARLTTLQDYTKSTQ